MYKDLKNDTFSRFRLSDDAEGLLRTHPLMAVADAAEAFGSEQVRVTIYTCCLAVCTLVSRRCTLALSNHAQQTQQPRSRHGARAAQQWTRESAWVHKSPTAR